MTGTIKGFVTIAKKQNPISALTEIKCKKRDRLLTVEEELRVTLSKIRPRIQKLCSEHQTDTSH